MSRPLRKVIIFKSQEPTSLAEVKAGDIYKFLPFDLTDVDCPTCLFEAIYDAEPTDGKDGSENECQAWPLKRDGE